MNVRLAPSILSADFAALGQAIAAAEAGGADLIHIDVMDGHFVPNITVGPPVVRSLSRVASVPLDVHLMIADPDRYIEEFIDAGASMVSVHAEASRHLHRTLGLIRANGAQAGVVLNPATPALAIQEVLGDLDFVLVMTVNPGFGGQTFIPRTESKVREVRAMLDAGGYRAPVEVDGGIDLSTIERIVMAGAEILVAGQAVFGTPDPAASVRNLRAAAMAAASRRPAGRPAQAP